MILVDVNDMVVIRDTLREKNFGVTTSLVSVPLEGFMALNEADFEMNLAAIGMFEALDDVDSVEHNIDLTGDDE